LYGDSISFLISLQIDTNKVTTPIMLSSRETLSHILVPVQRLEERVRFDVIQILATAQPLGGVPVQELIIMMTSDRLAHCTMNQWMF